MDFDTLYRQYAEKIYNYVYRRTSDPHVAQDLCSVTFLKAIEAERKGMGSTISISGYLYQIAHHLVIDHYRARDRSREVELVGDEDSDEFDPLFELLLGEEYLTLHVLIGSLTEIQRRAILLRYMEGRTFEEIAAAEEITVFAAKARLNRGVASLRLLFRYRL